MRTLVEIALPTLFSAAVIGFYASAYFKPTLFAMLVKAVLPGMLGIASLAGAYMIGVLVGSTTVLAKVGHNDFEVKDASWDALMGIYVEVFWVFGACIAAALATLAFVPIANHQLREEAERNSQRNSSD